MFVDKSYLQGNTYEGCSYNIQKTIELLMNLGFTIHPIKAIFLGFLGLFIDLVQITLEITEEKKNKIHNLCLEILRKEKNTLRKLAGVIEHFVTSFPAVPLVPSFYRNL